MWDHLVNDLANWLSQTVTHIPFRRMIADYLLGQGSKCMTECAPNLPHLSLAGSHDKLGWNNFVEGRISSQYLMAVGLPCALKG